MEKSVEKTDLRERIVTTASRLFQAQGVKQVRMDDIARELSISKKTLYELFSDKEELLLEVVKVISMGFHKNIKEIICSSANVLEQIFMLYKRVIEHCREVNPLFFIDLMRYPQVQAFFEQVHVQHADRIKEWLMMGVKQGLLRDDVNYEVFLRQDGFQMDKLLINPEVRNYPAEVIYDSVVLVMLRGLATEKGLEIIKQWKKK
ncbi:MAG: TetR/AcrR family transcriptional regulator [Bacteroidaceae bacterium]|nr:TetR/AcrR family transcriptional regulator [Bacteroidaceae bacterium]